MRDRFRQDGVKLDEVGEFFYGRFGRDNGMTTATTTIIMPCDADDDHHRGLAGYLHRGFGCSDHIADVRSACWVGEHGGLQISSREAMANSQAENIDHFIHMRTDQMSPKNVAGALFD